MQQTLFVLGWQLLNERGAERLLIERDGGVPSRKVRYGTTGG